MYMPAADMPVSMQQAALGQYRMPTAGYPPNGNFSGSQLMDGELANASECFDLENFHYGGGISAIRDSLDMAWLTSMPMTAQLDENVDFNGAFEW